MVKHTAVADELFEYACPFCGAEFVSAWILIIARYWIFSDAQALNKIKNVKEKTLHFQKFFISKSTRILRITEAAVRRCFTNYVLLRISPNSQGNTFTEATFSESCRPSGL